jgi:hypothetical protein
MVSLSAVSSSSYASGITHGAVKLVTNKHFVYTALALAIFDNLPTAAALNGAAYRKCMEICFKDGLGTTVMGIGGCAIVCIAALVVPTPPGG